MKAILFVALILAALLASGFAFDAYHARDFVGPVTLANAVQASPDGVVRLTPPHPLLAKANFVAELCTGIADTLRDGYGDSTGLVRIPVDLSLRSRSVVLVLRSGARDTIVADRNVAHGFRNSAGTVYHCASFRPARDVEVTAVELHGESSPSSIRSVTWWSGNVLVFP